MPDQNFWRDQTVLITGHMGFKGSWLCALLDRMGARTIGYGIDDREKLLYKDLKLANHTSIVGDVRDAAKFEACVSEHKPTVVLHLAAQPIVLTSYEDPLDTFASNVMGTANLLNGVRGKPYVKAAIVITSDKVYRNREWIRPYRETDELGGNDPYSASKAAAEIVTHSMAVSFFKAGSPTAVASVRAGHVIGGGDWADFRLLPDAARAFAEGQPLEVRNPLATRPWQHVLDPLNGYLTIAQALCENREKTSEISSAWNFGPSPDDVLTVGDVCERFVRAWGGDVSWRVQQSADAPKEARSLSVDSSLAIGRLKWRPVWEVDESIARTAHWYRDYQNGQPGSDLVDRDIDAFLDTTE